jgi:hypothetical protein
VLAIVPTAGLDAVLVAVELALAKNNAQLLSLSGLANLVIAKRRFLAIQCGDAS